MKYFNSSNGASYKGDKTIVTLADKEINSYLISRVKEKFPEHSVCLLYTSDAADESARWYLCGVAGG